MTHSKPSREPVVKRPLHNPGRRPATVAGVLGLALLVIAAPAIAAILLTSDAADLVQSIADQPALVTGAAFTTIPPRGEPHGIGDSPLAGFPLSGGTFAILTTGNAVHADEPNTAPNTSGSDGGASVRGDTDHDVSILRIDLDVPADANCLSIGFRFLSEEYPEFVDSFFNDAFIAELDTSTWTTSGTAISAPDNFAFDPAHKVISVNAVGPTNMTQANAIGTTYDGATPLLSASTPVTPGPHSLFLSIFDQGDDIFDSAVFLDKLVIARIPPEGCLRGATVLSASKITSTPLVAPGGAVLYTITIDNSGDAPETLNTITDALPSGFSYVTGSSSVLTTADPAVSGQNLTWNGPFSLAAHGSAVLTFSATASATPGDYLNNAGATDEGLPVTPTGPTAKVTVSPCVSGQDGVPCSDGNACTGPDTCSAGACVGGPNVCACQSNADCADNNPCTDDTCENPGTSTATCVHVDNTAPCSDGNACTGPDTCSAGACVGGPNVCTCQSNADCGDNNPCTDDSCENPGTPTASCLHVDNTAPCSDGNACTGPDTCSAGACAGGPNVCTCQSNADCGDNNPCTDDTCENPGTSTATCVHVDNTAPCSDGNACTGPDTCSAGACVGGPNVCTCQSNADCGDNNPCTDDTCENPGTSTATCVHVNNTAPCSDGNACTGPDTCSAGACVGGPNVCGGCQSNTDCGDDNPCTDDACQNAGTPNATCVHVNNTAPCSDGNACTRNDACQGGVCTGSNPVVCTPSDQCHVTGTCNPSTGACSNPPASNGTACSDGDVCTTNDACQAGLCRSGAHDDENPACNRPPVCSVALATPIELWPPNHKFVTVSIAGVTDPDGDSLATRIVGISQDEPLLGSGSGNTCPDGKGVGTSSASVRAERSGTGDGRVYHVSFTASDGKGGQCTGSVRICVPHDQRPGHVCGEDGPVIDSTGPCASR
jgi:uncharacterized repeat protein (TIGR01451 family)